MASLNIIFNDRYIKKIDDKVSVKEDLKTGRVPSFLDPDDFEKYGELCDDSR